MQFTILLSTWSVCDQVEIDRSGMLGKSSASPLLTFESSGFCPFLSSDVSTSTPSLALLMQTPPCGVRPHIQININKERCRILSCTLKRWKINSIGPTEVVVLEDEEKKTWEECKQTLSTLSFSADEADVMLRKAFGWIHSPYWGEEKNKLVPRNEMVNEVLEYLKGLGLSDDDLRKLLKKFPEVLGCDLDDEVKTNVATLGREWGIKGKTLRNLLLRNPKVLGYNVDCKGDCMAKCTRCWVRF
ncbi:uncharacterized protein LOC103711271 isoform X1 [Phoenix dactylifera]|uniref:Uncharacterized protein LOC103711271 isoform X1 n=2 Tax=Phoenix dactylifera TaxID=42345 RepID=A0A8B7CB90_PHODC|nr:uncharacterized protein LOC103711271 isoform X1 [Phoenix dactylifera]